MTEPRLFAIVLAAGNAERFGAVKQLQAFEGQTLVERAMRCAEELCDERTVLVTGNSGHEVHAACAPLRGYLVHNSEFATGMAGSISAGVAAVSQQADGVLIMLADQPLISIMHLQRLRELWLENPSLPIASRYDGDIAVPAIFPRQSFAALMALDGDQGARRILRQFGARLPAMDLPEAAFDVDRPEDLETLRKNQE